ncbi:PTS fructose transporter subunit IIB [Liquorilactobacillus satsumensis]|uniref:PTS fructose transporter subunit IIB n=1 Tax=Liquorilactobacillus satsumensis TaxID=259059 RepID=UPI0039EC8681
MIRILAACGAGVNSSHQIASAITDEMKKRGYNVKVDAVMIKDVNAELLKKYNIFTPISKTDLDFQTDTKIVPAGPILYRVPSMAKPVYDQVEQVIKKENLK